jgi:hypothetical protein
MRSSKKPHLPTPNENVDRQTAPARMEHTPRGTVKALDQTAPLPIAVHDNKVSIQSNNRVHYRGIALVDCCWWRQLYATVNLTGRDSGTSRAFPQCIVEETRNQALLAQSEPASLASPWTTSTQKQPLLLLEHCGRDARSRPLAQSDPASRRSRS